MNLQVRGFDWDDGNRSKCQKHGVSMAEIEALFLHGPLVAPDPKHSGDEDRLIAVGRTGTGRPLFVAFTMRAKDSRHLIRPVTARYMHAREIAAYEKQLMKKKVPRLRTDEEAEAFLAQDLSKLDFSQFKIVRFVLV